MYCACLYYFTIGSDPEIARIEKPMKINTKAKTIIYCVRSFVADRDDMGGFKNLGYLLTGQHTAARVCFQYGVF
jgi:hypothetical protein